MIKDITIPKQEKENFNRLIVLCGLQGAGKTTFAKNLEENAFNTIALSSDDYRMTHPELDNSEIFTMLYEDMNMLLKEQKNVIIDATNTTLKMRKKLFEALKEPVDEKICIIFNIPYEECIKNNKKRENPIPDDVLERYYHNFQIPFIEEGFDKINFINFDFDLLKANEDFEKVIEEMDFDQKSKYHTLSCKEHCIKTRGSFDAEPDNLEEIDLCVSSILHDYGKIHTQIFGEDGYAHYYNHANVGAYKLMSDGFNLFPSEVSALNVLFYVNYHMQMFGLEDAKESTKERWKQVFGEKKYNNLVKLYDADKRAH